MQDAVSEDALNFSMCSAVMQNVYFPPPEEEKSALNRMIQSHHESFCRPFDHNVF